MSLGDFEAAIGSNGKILTKLITESSPLIAGAVEEGEAQDPLPRGRPDIQRHRKERRG
jgi:hypothetical protein